MQDFSTEVLAVELEKLGFAVSSAQLEQLFIYMDMLLKWNKRMNLVGHADWHMLLYDLILDSFHLALFAQSLPLHAANTRCWDFGAGAGLPGIPLRILWQTGTYTMVEAREKRALFLQAALAACKLKNTYAKRAMVEDFMAGQLKELGQQGLGDILFSRAFMPWQDVLTLVQDNLKPDAIVVFLTLQPLPEGIPSGWHKLAEHKYLLPTCATVKNKSARAAGGQTKPVHKEQGSAAEPALKERYFWALQKH